MPLYADIDRLKLVFVDGVFDPDQSDDLAMEGVEIERLSDALKKDIHWARDLFGVLETRGQDPVERPLAALNTGFATDGIVIRATAKVARPISFVYLHRDETSDAMLHHVVRVEKRRRAHRSRKRAGRARGSTSAWKSTWPMAAHSITSARKGRDHERRAVTHMFARVGGRFDLQVLLAHRKWRD